MRLEDMILVSVDDHVVEPPDLFEGRLSSKHADVAPNLSRQSCKSVESVGKVEYWTCPVKLQAGPNA